MTLDPNFWTEPEEVKSQGRVIWVREDGTEIDPDTGEEIASGDHPGPESVLASEMLQSVRPTGMRFHSHAEATAWYKLEVARLFDSTQEEWYSWISNRCWCARQHRWSYQILMRAIRNEDKFRAWRNRQ